MAAASTAPVVPVRTSKSRNSFDPGNYGNVTMWFGAGYVPSLVLFGFVTSWTFRDRVIMGAIVGGIVALARLIWFVMKSDDS